MGSPAVPGPNCCLTINNLKLQCQLEASLPGRTVPGVTNSKRYPDSDAMTMVPAFKAVDEFEEWLHTCGIAFR